MLCRERKGHLEKNLSRRLTVDQMIREVPNLSLSLLCENLFFFKGSIDWRVRGIQKRQGMDRRRGMVYNETKPFTCGKCGQKFWKTLSIFFLVMHSKLLKKSLTWRNIPIQVTSSWCSSKTLQKHFKLTKLILLDYSVSFQCRNVTNVSYLQSL